ncbi:MAG: Smr/MutS family protein [Bacteroidales bacterium]|nr:Smr/MutS family protein [Bacteroidales bacterium]
MLHPLEGEDRGGVINAATNPRPKTQNPKLETQNPKPSYTSIIADKQDSFTLTLDLRGKRADEAFLELQRFIDDATLLSIREVRILHGKGTGALRDVTRNYLKGRKEVKSYQDEALERGGAGVTVASL